MRFRESAESPESLSDANSQATMFVSNSHDKRNLWWKAFRKTVLELHSIVVLEHPATDKVPEGLLGLVEEKCQNLERHERQALRFVEAVGQGRGFGPSLVFPEEIVPASRSDLVSRSLEPLFDPQTLPAQENNVHVPDFELPIPRPGLASGFSQQAFSEAEYKEVPITLAAAGAAHDCSSSRLQPRQTVFGSFLLFERTYGNARHEIESAMNYCAMDGAAALNALSLLYKDAWPDKVPQAIKDPVVFSCIIDDDLGIINHHWTSDGGVFVAPLCKFDLRDLEHFMHFLAWIEAIEEWATSCLLLDIRRALQTLVDRRSADFGPAKALPSPVTDTEKQEMLSHSMRLAFDTMPWKTERARGKPLGVTAAMRTRSPLQPSHSTATVPLVQTEVEDTGFQSQREIVATANSQPIFMANSELVNSPIAKPQSFADEKSKNSVSAQMIPPSEQVDERKNPRVGLSLIKSAGFVQNAESAKYMQQTTSAGLSTSKSSMTSMQFTPTSRVESSKTPWTTNSVGLGSPAQSVMSVQSKKSFTSLRKARPKTPKTPDSATTTSPKGTKFKSKISTSLDMIKEHTMLKRGRADNSAPSSAKDIPPLPTPAYDKKRFNIKTPRPELPDTPKRVPEVPAAPLPSTQSIPEAIDVSRFVTSEAYNARHALPFRQWAKSPTSTVTATTTLTAIDY